MDFWQFLGSYWWLAFPIMGVAGGLARRWEFGARARHKRRLEILQAKAALKAAQPPKQVASASEPRPLTKPSPTQPQLEKLFAEHDAVTARWLDYELDVAKLIAYPTISDGRQPLTAAFLRAKKTADRLRPANAKAHLTDAELAATEEAELAILEGYLPAQLGDDELAAIVARAVAATGATGMPQLGQVMKVAQAEVAGRADGGRVAAAVRSALG